MIGEKIVLTTVTRFSNKEAILQIVDAITKEPFAHALLDAKDLRRLAKRMIRIAAELDGVS